MKKRFLAIMATAALAGGTLIAFTACGGTGGSGGLAEGGMGGEGTSVEAGARNAYGIGAVTTAQLLAGGAAGAANASLAARSEGGSPLTDGGQNGAATPPQEELEQFNEYFQALDTFLNEDAFRTTVTENTDPQYAFDYRLTVEGEQLDGTTLSHTMYYSEEQVAVRPDDDDDDDEKKEAYRLTGVMLMDGTEYIMTGYRSVETETEHDETERSEEFWMRATHPDDPANYVQMDLETESESERGENELEREYVYSVYRDGRLFERTSVDFETEDEQNGTETEYTLSILRDGARSYYEVERAARQNGVVSIGVNYRLGSGERGRFVVTQSADGTFSYRFDDGSHIDFDDFDD